MSLISELDRESGKTAYQTCSVRLGIDLVEFAVPLKSIDLFEAELKKLAAPTRRSVLKLVAQRGGGTI